MRNALCMGQAAVAAAMLLTAGRAGAEPAKLRLSAVLDKRLGERLEANGVAVTWMPAPGPQKRVALVELGTMLPPKEAWSQKDGEWQPALAPDFIKALLADLRNQATHSGPGPYDSHVVNALRQEIEYEIRTGAPSRGLQEVTAPISDAVARIAVAGVVTVFMTRLNLPPVAGFLVGQAIANGMAFSGLPPHHDSEPYRARRHKGLTAGEPTITGAFQSSNRVGRRPGASGGGNTGPGSDHDSNGGSAGQSGNHRGDGGDGSGGVRGGRSDRSPGGGSGSNSGESTSSSGGSSSGGGSGSGADSNSNSGGGDSSNQGATEAPGPRDGGPDASGVIFRFDPGPFGPGDPGSAGRTPANDMGIKLPKGMSEAEYRARVGDLNYMDVTGPHMERKKVKTKAGADGKDRPDTGTPSMQGAGGSRDLDNDVRGGIYGSGYEPLPAFYKDIRKVSPIDPALARTRR